MSLPKTTVIEDYQPTLEEAKQAIGGGYVQQITLRNGDQLLMDEDGKAKGLPFNLQATAVASDIIFEQDFIVGDVLILKGKARW